MGFFEELKELGVDVDDGVDRMMGNAGLYEQMFGKLTEIVSGLPEGPDFGDEDISQLTEKVHMAKGVMGNLSVVPLYQGYTRILELLRTGKQKQAEEAYREILPVQGKILACIKKYL